MHHDRALVSTLDSAIRNMSIMLGVVTKGMCESLGAEK